MTTSTRSAHSLLLALGTTVGLGCAAIASAAGFDGSQDLLCAPSDVAQCDQNARCDRVSASEVDLPAFVRIEFGKKRLVSVESPERATPIETVRQKDGLTILQGAENGRAWSLVVDQASGRMTGSIADGEGVFALFGACTPR
ncbi:MAG TPA: hypothetical protein VMS55_22930 [Myxococcota bacterium]|nr:hypothetical protein [Myxococcota bacterium]